jgi:2,4-dichlorophenol 6-monooxygenase
VLCGWLRNRGIGSSGAVLVRPDRYVGFRAADAVSDPAAALAGTFDQILATG